MVKTILYEGTVAMGTGIDFRKGLERSERMRNVNNAELRRHIYNRPTNQSY